MCRLPLSPAIRLSGFSAMEETPSRPSFNSPSCTYLCNSEFQLCLFQLPCALVLGVLQLEFAAFTLFPFHLRLHLLQQRLQIQQYPSVLSALQKAKQKGQHSEPLNRLCEAISDSACVVLLAPDSFITCTSATSLKSISFSFTQASFS